MIVFVSPEETEIELPPPYIEIDVAPLVCVAYATGTVLETAYMPFSPLTHAPGPNVAINAE